MSAVPLGSAFTVLCPAVVEFMLDHLVSFDAFSSKLFMLASGVHVMWDIVSSVQRSQLTVDYIASGILLWYMGWNVHYPEHETLFVLLFLVYLQKSLKVWSLKNILSLQKMEMKWKLKICVGLFSALTYSQLGIRTCYQHGIKFTRSKKRFSIAESQKKRKQTINPQDRRTRPLQFYFFGKSLKTSYSFLVILQRIRQN